MLKALKITEAAHTPLRKEIPKALWRLLGDQ